MSDKNYLRDLISRFATHGRIEAIVLRPQRLQAAKSVQVVEAAPGHGLIGDHRAERLRQGDEARRRELSLIQAEHLPLIGAWTGQPAVDPVRLRRNLVVSGINLAAMYSPFADQRLLWRIGEQVCIEITGPCPPCSRMERELGLGGYSALRGHGGSTARIIRGGLIRVGDSVALCATDC